MAASKLKYDPDEAHRVKHRWDNPHADVVEENGYPVGKCPSTLDMPTAQRLLDEGIRYEGRNRGKLRPERVYNVHDGVPYRAHVMGGSYHGFPETPDQMPPDIRDELRARAEHDGDLEAFEEWMKRYEGI